MKKYLLIIMALTVFILFFVVSCQKKSETLSDAEAIRIASQVLIGKPSFSDDVPVDVEDRGESLIVFFTFPVPEGMEGGTYQSYAIIDKSSKEAIEFGVLEPGTTR